MMPGGSLSCRHLEHHVTTGRNHASYRIASDQTRWRTAGLRSFAQQLIIEFFWKTSADVPTRISQADGETGDVILDDVKEHKGSFNGV
jgi:hypothetical protein